MKYGAKYSWISFPYYIVRFKRHHFVFVDLLWRLFPYYIVRFKPKSVIESAAAEYVFPYYIVRFKRNLTPHFR